jgi:hypothetical protein
VCQLVLLSLGVVLYRLFRTARNISGHIDMYWPLISWISADDPRGVFVSARANSALSYHFPVETGPPHRPLAYR